MSDLIPNQRLFVLDVYSTNSLVKQLDLTRYVKKCAVPQNAGCLVTLYIYIKIKHSEYPKLYRRKNTSSITFRHLKFRYPNQCVMPCTNGARTGPVDQDPTAIIVISSDPRVRIRNVQVVSSALSSALIAGGKQSASCSGLDSTRSVLWKEASKI